MDPNQDPLTAGFALDKDEAHEQIFRHLPDRKNRFEEGEGERLSPILSGFIPATASQKKGRRTENKGDDNLWTEENQELYYEKSFQQQSKGKSGLGFKRSNSISKADTTHDRHSKRDRSRSVSCPRVASRLKSPERGEKHRCMSRARRDEEEVPSGRGNRHKHRRRVSRSRSGSRSSDAASLRRHRRRHRRKHGEKEGQQHHHTKDSRNARIDSESKRLRDSISISAELQAPLIEEERTRLLEEVRQMIEHEGTEELSDFLQNQRTLKQQKMAQGASASISRKSLSSASSMLTPFCVDEGHISAIFAPEREFAPRNDTESPSPPPSPKKPQEESLLNAALLSQSKSSWRSRGARRGKE